MPDGSPARPFGGDGVAILALPQVTAAAGTAVSSLSRNLSPTGTEQEGDRDVRDVQQHMLPPSLHGTRQWNGRRENIFRIQPALYLHQPFRIPAVTAPGAIRIIPAEQIGICAR